MLAMIAIAIAEARMLPAMCGSHSGKSDTSPTSLAKRFIASPDATGSPTAPGRRRMLATTLRRRSAPVV